MTWAAFIVVFLLPFGAFPAELNSKTNAVDLTDIPLEALLNVDIPKVYGASKIEQKTTEAPASITIITADEIRKQGHRTLADILRTVPGFNVSYDRNYAFLGVRGVSLGDFNSRILLLVDGHRVNNNLTDGGFIDTAFILDVDLIDRVEIIRGPSAVLYGNNAFLGVINVITKKGKQFNGFEVSGEYGTFDTYRARISYGKLFADDVQLLLSGTFYSSEGNPRLYYKEFNTPIQNNGVAQNMDGDTFGSFFGSLAYEDFVLEAAFIDREKVNPTAQFALTTFDDPRLTTIDQQGYAALKYSHSFPGIVDVTAQVYSDLYIHKIGYPQSVDTATSVLFSTYSSEKDLGEWWGTELQLNKHLYDRHVITLGAEYRDDFVQQEQISDEPLTARTRVSYGIYAQGDFALLDNLHLNAGARYDQYGDFDPAIDPRVALIYNPAKGSTVKAIYGTAFRAPNFSELSDPRFQDIKPEQITGDELDYEQEIGQHLRSSVSAFYNQMNNLIVFNSGNFTNFNAQTEGVELALDGTWSNAIRGRLSYSFQQTHDQSIGWQMPDSPAHMVKLNLSVPLISDKLFAGLEVQYTSTRLSLHDTTDAAGEPLTVQGTEAGGYEIVSLTLFSQKLIKNLEASASLYNILNCSYDDPASGFHRQDLIQQDGRSFRLKLTYRF